MDQLGDNGGNIYPPTLCCRIVKQTEMKVENNFIQWKGTDLCMDFHCECGTHNHYDGYSAYYVKCKGCEQIYKMDTKVMMEKVDDKNCMPLKDEAEI